MKKTAVMMMTAAALVSATAPLTAFAADSANISFSLETVDQNTNDLKTVTGTLTVTDCNGDGKITPDDALYLAHEKYYPGGAAAGYAEDYIWGFNTCYTCCITDQNGEYMYTSSGPCDVRYTLEDGDSISWTMQCIPEDDLYFAYVKELDEQAVPIAVGSDIDIQVTRIARFRKDADNVTAEGLSVFLNGENTQAVTNRNGYAKIRIKQAGEQYVRLINPETGKEKIAFQFTAYDVPAVNQTTTAIVTTTQTTAVSTETTAAATETTTIAAAASETALTSTSVSTAASVTTTAASATAAPAQNAPVKAGNVKTGDATPIAALLLAGLSAAGAAIFCTAKRREK